MATGPAPAGKEELVLYPEELMKVGQGIQSLLPNLDAEFDRFSKDAEGLATEFGTTGPDHRAGESFQHLHQAVNDLRPLIIEKIRSRGQVLEMWANAFSGKDKELADKLQAAADVLNKVAGPPPGH